MDSQTIHSQTSFFAQDFLGRIITKKIQIKSKKEKLQFDSYKNFRALDSKIL